MSQNIDSIEQERLDARIVSVLQMVTDENIDKIYASYANQLRVEADCGGEENQEEYNFLLEITDLLKGFIVQKYMRERGWYQSDLDDWNRWEREPGWNT